MSATQLTPSEPTNQLLNLAQCILNGEDQTHALDESLSAQLALVESEIELVPNRAQELGDSFLEHHGELYEALLHHMNLYHSGLLELASFFDNEEPNLSALENGSERLLEVTAPLVELQAIYGHVYSSFGSSRFPMVNVLERLLASVVKNPSETEEELKVVLAGMIETLEQSIALASKGGAGADEAKSGAEKAKSILSKIQKSYSDSSSNSKHLEELGEALFEMESGDEELRLSLQEGPSVMPAANIFINTARRAVSGELPKEAFMGALLAYEEHINENWAAIERFLEKPVESASVQEELPNTMELIDHHEETLERLKEHYEAGLDSAKFEEIVMDLIEVVEAFKESGQVFIEAAGRVGKIVCVSCGRGNPKTNNNCEACGVALPKIVDDGQSDSTFELSEHGGLEDENRMLMTTNLARIFQACEDIAENKIDTEEFLSVLEWADGLLKQMNQGLKQKEREHNHLYQGSEETTPELELERDTLGEVLAFFEAGIIEWEAGLKEIALYLEEPEVRHLKSGMSRVWEGASAIHRCQKIGDAAQQKLDELTSNSNQT